MLKAVAHKQRRGIFSDLLLALALVVGVGMQVAALAPSLDALTAPPAAEEDCEDIAERDPIREIVPDADYCA